MSEKAPTAIQLMARELVTELKPLMAELAATSNLNEALTKTQIARELRIDPRRVQALIDAGTIRTLADLGQMVSRRELERYTSGGRTADAKHGRAEK